MNNFNQLNMFRAIISPIVRSTRLCLQLVLTDDAAGWWPTGHQPAASSVHYTTSCKHSLVLLRVGEIIARNMLSWLKLFIKLPIIVASSWLYIISVMHGHTNNNLIYCFRLFVTISLCPELSLTDGVLIDKRVVMPQGEREREWRQNIPPWKCKWFKSVRVLIHDSVSLYYKNKTVIQ